MPRFTLFFMVGNLDVYKYDGTVVAGKRVGAGRDFDSTFVTFLRQELEYEFEERWVKLGFPVIEIGGVEAPDEKLAIEMAHPEAERIADALALLEPENPGIQISHSTRPRLLRLVGVSNVDARPPSVRWRWYGPRGLGRLPVGQSSTQAACRFNNEIAAHLLNSLPPSLVEHSHQPNEVERHLIHSLHWYSEASEDQDHAKVFLCIWLALEALLLEPGAKNKGTKIKQRLRFLHEKHVQVDPGDTPFQELWTIRCEIVHEGAGGVFQLAQQQVYARHINFLRWLYLLALLFICDRVSTGGTIEVLWASYISYNPSVRIAEDSLPLLYEIKGITRKRIEDA